MRDRDGRYERCPYFGPYRARYYRPDYHAYAGPYRDAAVHCGEWRGQAPVQYQRPVDAPRPVQYQRPNYTPIPQRPNDNYPGPQ